MTAYILLTSPPTTISTLMTVGKRRADKAWHPRSDLPRLGEDRRQSGPSRTRAGCPQVRNEALPDDIAFSVRDGSYSLALGVRPLRSRSPGQVIGRLSAAAVALIKMRPGDKRSSSIPAFIARRRCLSYRHSQCRQLTVEISTSVIDAAEVGST